MLFDLSRIEVGIGVHENVEDIVETLDVQAFVPEKLVDDGRCVVIAEVNLDDVFAGVLLDQSIRRSFFNDAAAVDDDDAVAEVRGFVHVMRCQQHCHALVAQAPQLLPHHVARLRVEACRRLIQHQDAWLVQQPACDGQPPLQSAGEDVEPVVLPVCELEHV